MYALLCAHKVHFTNIMLNTSRCEKQFTEGCRKCCKFRVLQKVVQICRVLQKVVQIYKVLQKGVQIYGVLQKVVKI
jgi:hypothetical protein